MAVPHQRDPRVTRTRLAEWCTRHLTGGARVTLDLSETPGTVGFANETVLAGLSWAGGRHDLVVRIASPTYQVYPWQNLHEQYLIMDALARHTDVPVPAVYAYEADPDVLGGQFIVMDRIPGRVPADFPSYHREGWVADLPVDARGRLWENGLAAMSRVHRVSPAALGLTFLGDPATEWSWLDEQIDRYADHIDFFHCDDSPVALRALDCLRGHRPPRPDSLGLTWGDARLGNLIFADLAVAAVLDWEMAAVGPAEVDLAWYLHLDRHLSTGVGARRLPGLPDRTWTIARYGNLIGRPMRALPYYEVFAGFRFALIATRVTELLVAQGVVPAGFALGRNAFRLLDHCVRRLADAPAAALA